MSRYNTQVLSNIRMLCRMQNIDEKVLYERAKLILSIFWASAEPVHTTL